MRVPLLACTLLGAAACSFQLFAQEPDSGNVAPAQQTTCDTDCDCSDCGCAQCRLRGCLRRACHGVCHHPPKHGNRAALYRASLQPWHGGYYYTQWGAPVSLVIPPTAEMHTDYAWGVPSMRVSRNDAQFQRPFPGNGYGGANGGGGGYGFLPTPYYPSDTNQFGVYYVRGPW